jgi:hypothetical protein
VTSTDGRRQSYILDESEFAERIKETFLSHPFNVGQELVFKTEDPATRSQQFFALRVRKLVPYDRNRAQAANDNDDDDDDDSGADDKPAPDLDADGNRVERKRDKSLSQPVPAAAAAHGPDEKKAAQPAPVGQSAGAAEHKPPSIDPTAPVGSAANKHAQSAAAMSTVGLLGRYSYIDLVAAPSSLASFKIKKGKRPVVIQDFAALGIGGLDAELDEIFRRTFSTRCISPDARTVQGRQADTPAASPFVRFCSNRN